MPRIVLFPVAAIAPVIGLAPMPAAAGRVVLISETCQPGGWLGGPIYGFPSSEWIFPEAGLVTRLTEGNPIANENCLARRILLGGDRRSVAFTMAGNRLRRSVTGAFVARSRTKSAAPLSALDRRRAVRGRSIST